MRFPSLMFEMRNGATVLGGRTAGRTGPEPASNKLGIPLGSPLPVPRVAEPIVPIRGAAWSASAETSLGIRDGVLKIISAGVIAAALFALTCVLAREGAFKG